MTIVLASLNRLFLIWLIKLEVVCSDLTLHGNLFHSAVASMVNLPMTFLGQPEETDSLFPRVRHLNLIRHDRWGLGVGRHLWL